MISVTPSIAIINFCDCATGFNLLIFCWIWQFSFDLPFDERHMFTGPTWTRRAGIWLPGQGSSFICRHRRFHQLGSTLHSDIRHAVHHGSCIRGVIHGWSAGGCHHGWVDRPATGLTQSQADPGSALRVHDAVCWLRQGGTAHRHLLPVSTAITASCPTSAPDHWTDHTSTLLATEKGAFKQLRSSTVTAINRTILSKRRGSQHMKSLIHDAERYFRLCKTNPAIPIRFQTSIILSTSTGTAKLPHGASIVTMCSTISKRNMPQPHKNTRKKRSKYGGFWDPAPTRSHTYLR